MHVEGDIFYRYDPEAPAVPVLVDVSRSGRLYPPDFRSPIPFTTLHDNVSMYVEEIWREAPRHGATLLQALFPNTYIDTNRHELDIDPSLIEGEWPEPVQFVSKTGLGLLKTVSRYGEPLQERKFTVAEVMARLDGYYRPYHREFRAIAERMRAAHGFYYNLSCHCMSAVGAPTHADAGRERMDFCIGNLKGTTSTRGFIEFVAETIRAQGYTCSVNTPYSGGEINRLYGTTDGTRESLMIEINKRTFMDVKTFRRNAGYDGIRAAAGRILAAVAEHARARMQGR
jgi:N-formylglutamate amidohydrolase